MKQIKKYSKKNVKKQKYKKYGGSSFQQKGIAAQLRPSIPNNTTLRKKLNEIVHSGDFYESKYRNSFLNLDNNFDPKAEDILNEATDFINTHKDLNTKIKKRVLNGIIPIHTTSTSVDTINYHIKSPTKTKINTLRRKTPTKTKTALSTRRKTKSRR